MRKYFRYFFIHVSKISSYYVDRRRQVALIYAIDISLRADAWAAGRHALSLSPNGIVAARHHDIMSANIHCDDEPWLSRRNAATRSEAMYLSTIITSCFRRRHDNRADQRRRRLAQRGDFAIFSMGAVLSRLVRRLGQVAIIVMMTMILSYATRRWSAAAAS